MCHLMVRELHKVAAPLFMYIVQLYKEYWGILHMLGCWAIALPSTEQIATLFCQIYCFLWFFFQKVTVGTGKYIL